MMICIRIHIFSYRTFVDKDVFAPFVPGTETKLAQDGQARGGGITLAGDHRLYVANRSGDVERMLRQLDHGRRLAFQEIDAGSVRTMGLCAHAEQSNQLPVASDPQQMRHGAQRSLPAEGERVEAPPLR